MKKYERNLILLVTTLAMVFLVSAVIVVADFTIEANQNPYVEAYLNELEQKGLLLDGTKSSGSDETIVSLNIYYQKDSKLSELIKEYLPTEFDVSLISSIEKEDKIAAMHMMQNIYDRIDNADCISLINDYFRRYANDSGDSQVIDFYNNIFDYAQSRKAIMDEMSKYRVVTKQELEMEIDNRRSDAASYDDNFSSTVAGMWAYNNYDKYNENFPAFINEDFGSDCMNFVSQALYFGGMEMHDEWYCHKKNNEYPIPANATQLDYSWTLEDPSPWISVEQFCSFWSSKTDDYYEYTRSVYTVDHAGIYSEPITKGDVIILCNSTLWWTTPSHAMIISGYDTTNKDFLCAGHSEERQACPLYTVILGYDVVRIYCF